MKVLLLVNDLYKNVGGGQTVYRTIIESSPQIEFYYFREREPEFSIRPLNAKALPLSAASDVYFTSPPPHQEHVLEALRDANRFARSVAGQTFDIVELPDFLTFGSLLRQAFLHHRIKVGRFVLAMHGNISDSIESAWGSPGDNIGEQCQLEEMQFDSVDGIYAISKRYIREWQKRIDRPVHFIDPAYFINSAPLTPWKNVTQSKPSLYCIGRSERRKGNDLFVELVRWTNPYLYDHAEHIGEYVGSGYLRSDRLLADIAQKREIRIAFRSTMSHPELHDLFARPTILVLPVRYDSLNLVCLEALFSGCPVVVSSNAGVCDYLDEFHPDLPYDKYDSSNLYGGVKKIEDLLLNYDSRRSELYAMLKLHPPQPKTPLDMAALYSAILSEPERVSQADLITSAAQSDWGFCEGHAPETSSQAVEALEKVEHAIAAAVLDVNGPITGFLHDTGGLIERLKQVGRLRERNQDALREKLSSIYVLASSPILRGNFWSEIARVERLRGQTDMALAYEMRLLRLMDEYHLGLLPRVTKSLNTRGENKEIIEAAQALYGPGNNSDQVYDLLVRRRDKLLNYKEQPLERLDDRRDKEMPKVSVIVSLYNAAPKLRLFLTMLCQQTLLRNGQVEVILVDSGSPADEHAAFEAVHADIPFSALYVRSKNRETIQAAWNRGIKLARAPYLVFLGVDEALYPEALAMLAEELDLNPQVDWVMANSLVTAVEADGSFKHDIMTYDRSGGTKDHIILETCYISWVGGMYRKTVHDRFGYYDEKFRGAGDTEFKNRILPQLQVKIIDRLLGLFLNYPEGQTTASPMAEIEDSRAWYLFRTDGGVRYLFENRPVEEAEALLALCLGYRKSFCGHISSDIELAVPLARHILSRKPTSALARLVLPDLERIQNLLRQLEFSVTMPTKEGLRGQILEIWRVATLTQERHRVGLERLGYAVTPVYDILNDNRYEQHSWLWKSKFKEL